MSVPSGVRDKGRNLAMTVAFECRCGRRYRSLTRLIACPGVPPTRQARVHYWDAHREKVQ